MFKVVIILTLVALAGCATSELVYLQNASGLKVQCGPYTDYGNVSRANMVAHKKLRDCISDYQRQGYERIPGP